MNMWLKLADGLNSLGDCLPVHTKVKLWGINLEASVAV